MKIKLLFLISLLIVLFLFLLPQITGSIKREYHAKKIYASCKKLQLGMTENKAVDIMGKADKTTYVEKDGKKKKYVTYMGGSVDAVNPHFIVDVESSRVIKIICDDNY